MYKNEDIENAETIREEKKNCVPESSTSLTFSNTKYILDKDVNYKFLFQILILRSLMTGKVSSLADLSLQADLAVSDFSL